MECFKSARSAEAYLSPEMQNRYPMAKISWAY